MLNNKKIPNEATYKKLRDFPDGEEIAINGCGINEGQMYGDIPYFRTVDGEIIQLPSRYLDYIVDIMGTPEDLKQIKDGVTIIKQSRKTKTGGSTPTFTYKE